MSNRSYHHHPPLARTLGLADVPGAHDTVCNATVRRASKPVDQSEKRGGSTPIRCHGCTLHRFEQQASLPSDGLGSPSYVEFTNCVARPRSRGHATQSFRRPDDDRRYSAQRSRSAGSSVSGVSSRISVWYHCASARAPVARSVKRKPLT